jgi:hypothetical protein
MLFFPKNNADVMHRHADLFFSQRQFNARDTAVIHSVVALAVADDLAI